ncbi:MAG: SRPBCC family protein [Aeromicrobium erythreum]
MSTITESVDVDVDIRSAYDQWTQFETFPEFMSGVDVVEQIDDTHLHWKVSVGPVTREFDATITDQEPDRKVAWRSDDGPEHAGEVTFEKLSDDRTRVTTAMTIDPDGFLETVGDKTGLLRARVEGDLLRFKDFIEARNGQETGAWRGEV